MSKKQATCVQCNKTYSHTSDLSLQYCSWSCEWGADAEQYYQWEDLVKEVKGTWVPENERIIATSTPPQTTSPSYKIFKESEE